MKINTIARPAEKELNLVMVFVNNEYIGTTTKDAISSMLMAMGINMEP